MPLRFSRPDCDRAPSPRRGQGRHSRRMEALTLPTREGARWRWSKRIQASVITSCSGEGTLAGGGQAPLPASSRRDSTER